MHPGREDRTVAEIDSTADCRAFCDGILPAVSRSFALIIPKCPPPLDTALCVAYLLCRIADTIEDEPGLPPDLRNRLYDAFLAVIDAPDPQTVADFKQIWPSIPSGAYGTLIAGTQHVLQTYLGLPEDFSPPVRCCVHEMIAGMRSMAPAEVREGITFYCRDLPALDRYCHYVAGTVGIMSTALFEIHLRAQPAGAGQGEYFATPAWREDGRRMGLGLQMTNIIKDCRVDAERKVSFIPSAYVALADGYDLTAAGRHEVVRHALGHLDAAMRYIEAVPAGQIGIRTFLLGSVFPAVATLRVVASGRQYHPKISRLEMARIFGTISRHAARGERLQEWYQRRRETTLKQLHQ